VRLDSYTRSMRDAFRGYYAPTETELDELWKHGTIVFDTSALLNLYRYPLAAREGMLAVLRTVRDRLWIPYQVALEYHRRRVGVIENQLGVFEKVRHVLGFSRLKAQLDALQLRRFHSLISVDGVLAEIQPPLERFESQLAELENEHVKPTGPDVLRDSLQELFGAKIGSAPTPTELEAIYREGATRYERLVPPGYADAKDKSKQQGFTHGGAIYLPMYGDLVGWLQIIGYAAAQKLRSLMLVSDDEKSDWRQILEYRGRRELLPRPELIEEIRRDAGVEIFTIYSSDTFLHFAKERLGITIADATISQVTTANKAARIEDDPRATDEHLSLVNVIGTVGNRRDAVLECGFCDQQDISLYFYEDSGIPTLPELLGFFHYWRCPAYSKGTPVNLLIFGEDREPKFLTWTPLPHQR
jgi:PIN domain-containing protein